jgi:secondary thiamine-phosphate synthase enzyme
MVNQLDLTLPEYPRGFHLITHFIEKNLPDLPKTGILNIFTRHTSCGLSINENADPSVRVDFESIMNNLIPESEPYYTHTLEGAEDMPAHVKSSLFGQSITVPIKNFQMDLGTWQGIYLCEFRNHGGNRKVTVTIIGE